MEEKMISVPIELFKEGIEAIANCKAIEAIVLENDYAVRKQAAHILGIELEGDD